MTTPSEVVGDRPWYTPLHSQPVAAGAGAMHPSRLDATGPLGAPAATSPRLCSCKRPSVIRYTWGQSVTEVAYCGSCALQRLSWQPALDFALRYGMGASA